MMPGMPATLQGVKGPTGGQVACVALFKGKVGHLTSTAASKTDRVRNLGPSDFLKL